MSQRYQIPATALDWIVGQTPCRVLLLSGSGPARTLHRAGHEVWVVDKSEQVTATMAAAGLHAVAAEAEQLPFDPCVFDVVIAHQDFHRYAPGLALSEMARVLRPGGRAVVTYLVRDDSVPWVRRLIARVQQLDPDAMRGNYGAESAEALQDSKYFPTVDHRSYRHWQPLSRADLLAMVQRLPAVQGLDQTRRDQFLDEINELHHQAASGAGGLRLPYTLLCWRAWVDHTELTAPIEVDDTGLVIPL